MKSCCKTWKQCPEWTWVQKFKICINSVTPVVFPYSITMNVEFFRFICTVPVMLCGKLLPWRVQIHTYQDFPWFHSYDYCSRSQLRSYPCNLWDLKSILGISSSMVLHLLKTHWWWALKDTYQYIWSKSLRKQSRNPLGGCVKSASQPESLPGPHLFLKLFRLRKIYSM